MLDSPTHSSLESWRWPLRWLAAVLFVAAGANHFVMPKSYRKIIPPGFPSPGHLVAISGVCEIAGGLGLLIRPLRRPAGWGLVALLVAVFPANLYMALAPERTMDRSVPLSLKLLLWLRLPLQGVLIAWVVFAAGEKRPRGTLTRISHHPSDFSWRGL